MSNIKFEEKYPISVDIHAVSMPNPKGYLAYWKGENSTFWDVLYPSSFAGRDADLCPFNLFLTKENALDEARIRANREVRNGIVKIIEIEL